jgi:hypothetical protein
MFGTPKRTGWRMSASPLHLAKRCGHKTDKPNTLVDLFDADGLSGKDGVEIDFFVTKVDVAAMRNYNRSLVE